MLSLLPGERILWEGHPPTGLMFQPMDILLIPFSFLWAGFAFAAAAASWTSNRPGPPLLFLIPFLLAGLYVTVGRFVIDMWLRRRTAYFVTNQRVILRKGNGGSIRSLDIRRLPMLDLRERADGSGTINFDREPSTWFNSNSGMGFWSPAMSRDFCFMRIPNVRTTYNLIVRRADQPA